MSKGATILALLVVGGGIARIASIHQQSAKLETTKAALTQAVADFRSAAEKVSIVDDTQIPLALAAEGKALATLETIVKNAGWGDDGELILKAAHDRDEQTRLEALNRLTKAKLSRMHSATAATMPALP